MQHLLRAKPTVILVASTTAPAGPEDVVGRAMSRVGCHLERFLAPVEPGNLFLLGYKDDAPIVSAPGASVPPKRMWWIWCCRPCWRAIAFPAGKWLVWAMEACSVNAIIRY